MRKIAVFIVLLAQGACAATANSPTPSAALPAADQIEKSCILASSDRLRRLNGLSASDGRALPSPSGKPQERLVELDTVNAGMKVTYLFACLYDARTSAAFAKGVGRKS